MSSMLGDKIIVKLLENLLYLTAIGTVSQVNIVLEECRSHEWQNNTCSSGKYGLEHFLDTDKKRKLDKYKLMFLYKLSKAYYPVLKIVFYSCCFCYVMNAF